MKDNRTIVQILFSRRKPVEGFPVLSGMQTLSYPARRNKGKAVLSAMLCKAVIVALKGDVTQLAVLEPPGKLKVKSRSQSKKSSITTVQWSEKVMWLPFEAVTYHLGLLLVAEALTRKDEAVDLLDGWQELLVYKARAKPTDQDRRYAELVGHVSDELWYWAAYENRAPDTVNRLDTLEIQDAAVFPLANVAQKIDPQVLTDVRAFLVFRGGTVEPQPEEPLVFTPDSRFRGWQLPELVEDLRLGFHCLLVGPTSTGKSLCALEAFKMTTPDKPVFIIEGHESMKEFDLLGSHVPEGKNHFPWHDGMLVKAMRAGAFLFIDEANRMPTRTLNILLGVLSRGAVVLTEHRSEEVIAQPGFQVVLAMNLGHGYAVNQLDPALLNRFPVTLEYRYLPIKEEIELLVSLTGIEERIAQVMVKVAQETRAKKKTHELSGEITPRGLLAWAQKIKGKTGDLPAVLQHAAKVTWMHSVAGIDSDGYLKDEIVSELLILIESHTPRSTR